jgi:cysteine desulfurase
MSRYFDAASGLPLGAEARRALTAALDHGWADPARLHRGGRVARQLLDAARASVATSLGALPQEVTFTCSGTAALHAGILGLARARRKVGAGVVASAVEHSAVLRAAEWVSPEEPVLVGVDAGGLVDAKAFRRAVRAPGVALACVQHVNHEVGAVQPLAQVHAAARRADVPLLVDACASVGSHPLPADWDVLCASAHKWGGPAGVGVLAVRSTVRWRSPLPTDPGGRWAGFPDVPGVVAAATALERATAELGRTAARRRRWAEVLRSEVPRLARDVTVVGPADSDAAPHIVCFTILYADGEVLVTELDRAGFAVSSGSACTSDVRRPSHVLAAMGAITHGNLRVSLPPDVTEEDVRGFLAVLPGAIAAARESAERAAEP